MRYNRAASQCVSSLRPEEPYSLQSEALNQNAQQLPLTYRPFRPPRALERTHGTRDDRISVLESRNEIERNSQGIKWMERRKKEESQVKRSGGRRYKEGKEGMDDYAGEW